MHLAGEGRQVFSYGSSTSLPLVLIMGDLGLWDSEGDKIRWGGAQAPYLSLVELVYDHDGLPSRLWGFNPSG